MVIDTNNNLTPGSASSARSRNTAPVAPSGSKATAAPAETATNKENVVLSQEAQRLNRLQASISQAPDVDVERVAALKLAIASGRFEINAERIAENLLKQDDLLG
jgi:negative regulator of flagellin synthesis FlgM